MEQHPSQSIDESDEPINRGRALLWFTAAAVTLGLLFYWNSSQQDADRGDGQSSRQASNRLEQLLNPLGEHAGATLTLARGEKQATDDDLDRLTPLGVTVRILTLESDYVTDTGVDHLSRWKELNELKLGCPRVTPQGLAMLASLSRLTKLDLRGVRLSEESLAALAEELPNLTVLCVANTFITDDSITALNKFQHISVLDLSQNSISREGLASLSLDRLKVLGLAGSATDDDSVASLVKLQTLEVLYLEDSQVTDAAIATFVQLPKLRALSLSGSQVTPQGAAAIHRALRRRT